MKLPMRIVIVGFRSSRIFVVFVWLSRIVVLDIELRGMWQFCIEVGH